MQRFAYEYAERTLDSFVATVESKQFYRSYTKFRLVLDVFAYCDFSHPERPGIEQTAWAWEDAQIAFNGNGEPSLHGIILQMWTTLPVSRKDDFTKAIETAFRLAEEHTPRSVARRYLSEWRHKPVRDPDLGFNLVTILPVTGVTLREWAYEEVFDPEGHEEYLCTLEFNERIALEVEETQTRRPRLRLLEGGQVCVSISAEQRTKGKRRTRQHLRVHRGAIDSWRS